MHRFDIHEQYARITVLSSKHSKIWNVFHLPNLFDQIYVLAISHRTTKIYTFILLIIHDF